MTYKTLSLYASVIFSALICSLSVEAQPFIPRDLMNEQAGAGWNFASASHRVFDVGGTYRPDVKYTSVGTLPSLYLFEEARTGWVMPILDPNNPGQRCHSAPGLELCG